MKTEPLSTELQAGFFEPPTDVQMITHAAWLLAGVAIAIAAAGCTVADEAQLHAVPADNQNQTVAHATPSTTAGNGNVQDLTY